MEYWVTSVCNKDSPGVRAKLLILRCLRRGELTCSNLRVLMMELVLIVLSWNDIIVTRILN